MIVWAATGIWHGASWNFLVWGLYFGVILILEKFLFGAFLERLPRWVGWCYTMLAVIVGWCFFSFDALGDGALYLTRLLGLGGVARWFFSLCPGRLWPAIRAISPVLHSAARQALRPAQGAPAPAISLAGRWAACLAGLFICMGYVVDSSYNPFLYFRF